MGEVVVADNTVMGEGIVLAQRLEQLAEPGGVCMQTAAYQTVPKRLPFAYENLGERELQGFKEPVRAYSVRQSQIAASSKKLPQELDVVTLEVPSQASIGVLPFASLSSDPEQTFFADGLVGDLIAGRSRIRKLFVISWNTLIFYRDRQISTKKFAEESKVR